MQKGETTLKPASSKPNEEKIRKKIKRMTKIIAWLIPRFHRGLSDPKNYEKLIGRVE
jgi:hypothetical protein|tara:strand:+ start:984 stop:1154 length:171 start_codon:yes stop_codon:yes gene_type:complete